MPERILGLDSGANGLKAVLLSRGFKGGYRVVGARRIAPVNPDDLAAALQELFADPAFRNPTAVTALPAGLLSFRNLRLPFHDERRIRQTLAFALEPLIQTPLEEVFIDGTTTAVRAGKAEIFAALAPRALVGERVELLKPYVRETAVIDVGAVPLAIALTKDKAPETVLLLAVGGRDATAVFVRRGVILQVRHFPFGGERATGAVAEALGCDVVAAEARKRSGELPAAAAAAIRAVCEGFGRDLKNTVISLLWQGVVAQPPARILLTGGGSLTPGLAEVLAASFAVPVERANLAELRGIQIDEPFRKSWEPAVMDQALALAARSMGKGHGFNFRQQADAARAGYGAVRDLLKKGAVAAAVILVLAGIGMGLDDYGDRLRLAALKKDIQAEFKRIDPGTTRIVDPVAQLRGKIAAARKVSEGLSESAGTATALDLLRELSQLAPADLLVTSLNLDGNAFALKGQARNFDDLEAFKKAFAPSQMIRSVTIDGTNTLKQGEGVEFDLKGVLKK
ncbi:MAG: pilus assembly protein PilM [Deltaproteobacteria bacterium]|nr:pilus assembly protein PilM [Deltaproteobacteria bacterium]